MQGEVVKPLFVAILGAVGSFSLGSFDELTEGLLVLGRFLTAIAMIAGSSVAIYRLVNPKKEKKNVNKE